MDDDRRDRNTHSVLLRGSYAFSPKFSLTGLLSFVRQEEVIDNIGGGRTKTYAVFYNVFKPGMSWTNVLTYRLTSPADRFNGAQEYEFGNELQWITGLADSYFIGLWVVDPALFFRYRNTAIDRVNGVKSANTGGNWLHLMPVMFISTKTGASA